MKNCGILVLFLSGFEVQNRAAGGRDVQDFSDGCQIIFSFIWRQHYMFGDSILILTKVAFFQLIQMVVPKQNTNVVNIA